MAKVPAKDIDALMQQTSREGDAGIRFSFFEEVNCSGDPRPFYHTILLEQGVSKIQSRPYAFGSFDQPYFHIFNKELV